MKIITTILLTIFILSCSGQEPDTHSYSDSLFQATIDSINLAHSQEIETYKELLNNQTFIGNVDLSVLDTANGAVTSLRITDKDKWYSIVKDDTRHTFNITDNELEIWLREGLQSQLIVRYDLELQTLTYLQYK